MLAPRNFPPGVLRLEEYEGNTVTVVHAEMKNTLKNRGTLQRIQNDLLMINPKLNLRIIENNA